MTSNIGREQLRAFVERIERLEEEKAAIADDIKEVYAEAKANGFEAKIVRKLVKIRKDGLEAYQEAEAILDLYMHAMGMVPDDYAADPETGEVPGPEADIREPIRAARHSYEGYRNPTGFDVGEGQ